jgi:hypothetical protein
MTRSSVAIVASIALAVLLFFVGRTFPSIQQGLCSAGYPGTFVLGLLYVSSFTSLSAAALLFLMAQSHDPWLVGTVTTLGAVAGDLVVFGLFRSATRPAGAHADKVRYAGWWSAIEGRVPPSWHPFVLMAIVAVFLLTPLPNEFADYLLARSPTIKARTVLVISYVLNGVGIYTIVWLARL